MALTWAGEQTITQLTSVVDTEQQSTTLDLTGAYQTEIEVRANSDQSTPTDALIIRVYKSADDSEYDDVAWVAFTFLPTDTNTRQKTINLPICRYVKLGFESAGATDTYVADADYHRLTAV